MSSESEWQWDPDQSAEQSADSLVDGVHSHLFVSPSIPILCPPDSISHVQGLCGFHDTSTFLGASTERVECGTTQCAPLHTSWPGRPVVWLRPDDHEIVSPTCGRAGMIADESQLVRRTDWTMNPRQYCLRSLRMYALHHFVRPQYELTLPPSHARVRSFPAHTTVVSGLAPIWLSP